mgnify:CR=1 FL=1
MAILLFLMYTVNMVRRMIKIEQKMARGTTMDGMIYQSYALKPLHQKDERRVWKAWN